MSSVPEQRPRTAVFRLPRSAYVAVLFLLFGVAPLAFTRGGDEGSRAVLGPRVALLLLPLAAALFIARTATVVSPDGIEVRALLGRRRIPWTQLRGLSVRGTRIYAVLDTGAFRLPCVGVADLHAVAEASDGRLPPVAAPVPKHAPARRRRR